MLHYLIFSLAAGVALSSNITAVSCLSRSVLLASKSVERVSIVIHAVLVPYYLHRQFRDVPPPGRVVVALQNILTFIDMCMIFELITDEDNPQNFNAAFAVAQSKRELCSAQFHL